MSTGTSEGALDGVQGCNAPHCKDLHLKYISTTTLEMYPTSVSGAQLPDVAYYISSTSPLHLSVVIITTI